MPRALPIRSGEERIDLCLRAVHPPGLSFSVELERERLVLGREKAEGVEQIEHPTISRRHLAIEWDAQIGTHVATELGSRNGSWVDGVALESTPRALAPQSVLRLGDVLLVLDEKLAPAQPDAARVSRDSLPGESAAMAALRAEVARAAAGTAPVLVLGETGTGKEWVARELHRLSGRRGKLVPVNCAALSAQLVESQLFGHVRGAFTGASDAQQGFFRAAQRGTLLLDEIGELPPDLQPKLLRALEEGEVVPVGSAEPQQVDVRVVAATNRDLAAAVETRAFRRDLYTRLSFVELRVPPLRDRRADLFGWIERFTRLRNEQRPEPARLEFSADAAEAVLLCPWPGNLRSLHRLVHELCAAGISGDVAREQLPPWARPPDEGAHRGQAPEPKPAPEKLPPPTRAEFEAVFTRLNGSVRAVARHFGRDRRQIYRWMATYNIRARPGEDDQSG